MCTVELTGEGNLTRAINEEGARTPQLVQPRSGAVTLWAHADWALKRGSSWVTEKVSVCSNGVPEEFI